MKDVDELNRERGPAAVLAAVEGARMLRPDSVPAKLPEQAREPFVWHLRDAADVWTDDPARLRAYSDPAIVHGLLREREMVQVVGAAKLAKSWLVVAMGLAIASGAPFLGFTTSQRKVLFLDFELKEEMFAKRLSMLAPDCPSGFHFQCLRGRERRPTPDDIADLVKREGFGVCFIDSLYVTGWLSEENNNDSTARELRHVQSVFADSGCSLVCVDHTSKGGGAERSAVDASRGASSKGGIFDAVLTMRPTTEGKDEEARYAVLDPALRDWPAFKKLPLLAFRWTETTADIDVEGEVAANAAEEKGNKILEALAASGTVTSVAELVKATGIKRPTVYRLVGELVTARKVEETRHPTHPNRLLYSLPGSSQTVSTRST